MEEIKYLFHLGGNIDSLWTLNIAFSTESAAVSSLVLIYKPEIRSCSLVNIIKAFCNVILLKAMGNVNPIVARHAIPASCAWNLFP